MKLDIDLPEIRNKIDPKYYFIDATPDGKFAIRILKFYRMRCDEKWAVEGENADKVKDLYQLMNDHQDMRAKELDAAIQKLEEF